MFSETEERACSTSTMQIQGGTSLFRDAGRAVEAGAGAGAEASQNVSFLNFLGDGVLFEFLIGEYLFLGVGVREGERVAEAFKSL